MNELVRIVADWLEAGTVGVNALLASVPRDNGDAAPTSVLIYDETRDNRPARGRVPDGAAALPALSVSLARLEYNTAHATDTGDVRAALQIQYAATNTDAWKAKQDAYYVLRAVVWSLRKLRATAVDHASRTRNSVVLLELEPPTLDPMFERIDDTLVVGTLTLPITARDFGLS